MAYLTPNQIAQLAYNAGFRGSALRMAVAIALAESSGDPNSYNPELQAGTKKNHGSRGLWQIYGTAHPEYDNAEMFNPVSNANAAFQVYKQAGNRFVPWSTFNNGSASKISQKLNVDLPTGEVNLSSGAASDITGGAIGGMLTGGMIGGLTGAGASAGQAIEQNVTDQIKPNISISLLPENVKQGIENIDPQFVKKSMIFGFLGFLFLTIGLIMLISALTPQPVKDLASEGVKTGAKLAVASAL
jgi:hypothetical protein